MEGRKAREAMQYIPRLLFIPPSERLHGDANLLQGRLGLLNLNLRASVRQHKWNRISKKNLHPTDEPQTLCFLSAMRSVDLSSDHLPSKEIFTPGPADGRISNQPQGAPSDLELV